MILRAFDDTRSGAPNRSASGVRSSSTVASTPWSHASCTGCGVGYRRWTGTNSPAASAPVNRYQPHLAHALNRHGMVGSMGRVGAAGDNAAMESWFALLQKNVFDRRAWATREELRIAIFTWIERTYHRRRRQSGLGRLTPVEYELIMTTAATRAA